MARYTVGHSYAASRDGKQLGPWVAGDEVELDDAEAAWVERDSPGALVAIAKPARAVKRGG